MGNDKRKVSTDALETLGSIIDETAGRDAIHLAVEPVVAGEKLYAGQHIGVVDGVATTKAKKKLGIVDPFVREFIPKGERFWLVIYPRTITSLRHVWSHPELPESKSEKDLADEIKEIIDTEVNKSKEWINQYSNQFALSYDSLMDGATDFIETGNNIYGGDNLEGESISSEFWDHYEIVTNKKIPNKKRGTFFSCAC